MAFLKPPTPAQPVIPPMPAPPPTLQPGASTNKPSAKPNQPTFISAAIGDTQGKTGGKSLLGGGSQ